MAEIKMENENTMKEIRYFLQEQGKEILAIVIATVAGVVVDKIIKSFETRTEAEQALFDHFS